MGGDGVGGDDGAGDGDMDGDGDGDDGSNGDGDGERDGVGDLKMGMGIASLTSAEEGMTFKAKVSPPSDEWPAFRAVMLTVATSPMAVPMPISRFFSY